MRPVLATRRIALCAFATLSFLAAQPAFAQAPLKTNAIVDGLTGFEEVEAIDIVVLRKAAQDRIKNAKTNADRNPVNRPPISDELLKLPQVGLDITFKPDSSTIDPVSYTVLGRLADALYHPRFVDYRFLIVAHTESGGRREDAMLLSQKRADAIREALSTVYFVSAKRLQSLGLGEEQLTDRRNPKAIANQRVQLVAMGKFVRDPAPPKPVAAKPKPKPRR